MSRADRLAHLGLALAMAASAALLLWTTRGFTFYNDEVGWFSAAPVDYDPAALLRPHITHLIAVHRIVYATSLHLFGPEYLPLRVVSVLGVLLCAGLFFRLAARSVGASAALAPTIVLLFLGTSWNTVIAPIGIPYLLSVAAGLGALLALERRDRRGDIAACLLTVLSLASFSFGLSFLIGVAVSVLRRRDRVGRLWIFVVPLVLYAVWWLLTADERQDAFVQLANVVGLPLFVLLSLGATLTSVVGLNLSLDPASLAGFDREPTFAWSLVPVLALAGLVALVLGVRRRRFGPALWVFAAVLLGFWVSIGLSVGPGREPTTTRYVFPAAVMLLLVGAELARGARLPRPALVAIYAVAAVSMTVNVIHFGEARRFLAAYSANVRPTLAMLELTGDRGDPAFRPGVEARGASPRQIGVSKSTYLAGVRKWGSIAVPLAEVRQAPTLVRDRADLVLARALGLRFVPAPSGSLSPACTSVGGTDRPARVRLPAGGVVLRSLDGGGGPVALRRFGDSFSVVAGDLPPGGRVLLEIPRDRASEPWFALLPRGEIELCATRVGEARTRRYCALRGGLEAARGLPPEQIRPLVTQLLASAPPEIEVDLKTVIAAAVAGGGPGVAAAQARIDAFETRRCGG